jgi:site-specific DNA recombinase
VRQLERALEQVLARAWAAGAGPGAGPLVIDLGDEREVSLSRMHTILHNRVYCGYVPHKKRWYRGRHQPLISEELFEQVQAVMAAHDKAGDRQRLHQHYLKGSIFCARCGSRLKFSRNRGNGGTYDYFMCARRHRGEGCALPYLGTEAVEDSVVRYWKWVQRDKALIEAATQRLRELTEEGRRTAAARSARCERTLAELFEEERGYARQAARGTISDAVLDAEVERIREARRLAERELALSRLDAAEYEQAVADALWLLAHCARPYKAAPPAIRRLFNQVFFEKLLVGEHGVTRGEWTEPVVALVSAGLLHRLPGQATPNPDLVSVGQGSTKNGMERARGVEPPSVAWKAIALPLSYAREGRRV